MNKEQFEVPVVEFVKIEADVICASGCSYPENLAEMSVDGIE